MDQRLRVVVLLVLVAGMFEGEWALVFQYSSSLTGCINVKGQESESSDTLQESNLVLNPGFEEGQFAWAPYSPDLCTVTSAVSRSGTNSLECSNPGPYHKQQGLKQTMLLNQASAQPIIISGMYCLLCVP